MTAALLTVLLALAPRAEAAKPKVPVKPPKLTVLLVVDQLPADALVRHRPYFNGGGLIAFLERGSVFQQAFFKHATTMTGPGHSVLGSGQYGNVTGIVSNEWLDAKSGQPMYCVADPSVKMSTPTAFPVSPKNFEGISLASRVKKRWPKSRVVSVSLKDRAAILMVGQGADAAYWYDGKAKSFVSSSAFPYDPKVLAFNKTLPQFLKGRSEWNWSISVPTKTVCPSDKPEYHEDNGGLGLEFPHKIKDFGALLKTPYGNDVLEQFAEEVVKRYDLGRNPDGEPDVLAISFSAYDYMGHAYGPDSCEMADATARLDQTLDRFLQFLQAMAPKEDLEVLLTADHGSAPIPELVKAGGKDAGRLNIYDPEDEGKKHLVDLKGRTLSKLTQLRSMLEQGAASAFDYSVGEDGPFMIASFQEPCLYLDPQGPAKGREDRVRYWLKGFLGVQESVQSVHTTEDFGAKKAPESMLLSWRKDRSGDVCLILKEHYMWEDQQVGTNHGQPWEYDMHVPILLWGGGIPAGDHHERVSTGQVAPTLASFLDLSMDGYAEPKPLMKRE